MTEIFGILMEHFGTLAWWYALGQVVTVWFSILIMAIMVIELIKVFCDL